MTVAIIQNPTLLIGPAVLISVFGYLVHFFGKIIADQKPFSDNRSWEIELSGLTFFLNLVIVPGALGFALARYAGNLGTVHWVRFVLASALGAYLLLLSAIRTEVLYGIKLQPLRKLLTLTDKTMEWETFRQRVISIGRYLPLWLFSILFIYLITVEYYGGNFIWLTIIATEIFFNFILLAINFSLLTSNLPKVDVYLIDKDEPLRDLTLLKINEDNIRLRDRDRAIILNKNLVLKIETRIDQ